MRNREFHRPMRGRARDEMDSEPAAQTPTHSMPALRGSPLSRLVDALVRHRMPILVGTIALSIVSAFWASRLTFDQSIEALYSSDDPHLRDYLESKRLFGGDELVGVAYRDAGLLDEQGLTRARKLAAELSRIPGVRPQSTQNLADGLAMASGPKLAFLRGRRKQILEFFRGILIGADNETTAVVLRLEAEGDVPIPPGRTFAELRARTIADIRAVADRHAGEYGLPTYVVGEPVQVHDMFRYVQQDGAVLGWASTALLVVVILVLFRNLRWVLLPILVVQAALLWTKAILVLSRIPLTMVSSILESLVTIIGVATVMHISLVYCEVRLERDRAAALSYTLVLLASDVFWVCATTAAGFAAQLSSHVYPVQSFGLMMTLGSMLIIVAIGAILPGGVLLGRFASDPIVESGANSRLGRSLALLCHWVERHPWRVLSACLAVTAVALSGMVGIRVETDFSRNFRNSSPIVRALVFVEEKLGGAGTWEINFPAPEALDETYLDRIRALAERLRRLEVTVGGETSTLTKVVAVTDGIDLVPRIPLLVPDLARQMTVLETMQPEFVSSLYNPQSQRMRIALRARERQPAELKQTLIEQVEQIVRDEFPESDPGRQPRATGLFVLLTHLIESLLGDQWSSFGWGAVGIIGIMTIAYRNLRIGLISLFPNLFPIVMVVGAMGWLDLPVNIGTAMISAVSMGLTVDASIFYISAFRRAQRQGLDVSAALRVTQHDVGRALVYSNLALILGFLVLTLSNFVPLIYFGFLVSLAMVGGLAGNLLLLPLLLRFVRV
jgi:predicted RND superfamily exporter protein